MYTVGLAHLGSRLKGPDLAQANAAFILCYAIGMVIGPQIAGVAMDIWGPARLAVALSGMFIGYLCWYWCAQVAPSSVSRPEGLTTGAHE